MFGREKMKSNRTKPPEKFLWGVATSAFQIEGFLRNDMTEWETQGGFRQGGKDPRYADAAAHWRLWEKDFSRLTELGVNAYRFSMAWGRIEPHRGQFDAAAMAQYDRMVDRLLEMQITPMLTLHHFTHPAWFHHETPWHTPEAVDTFCGFAEKIVNRFGDRIHLFVTLNEPLVWLLAAYGDGKFPPGEKDPEKLGPALKHMLEAHGRVYDLIKARNPDAQAGIAKNLIVFRPERLWHPLDHGINFLIHRFYNRMIFDAFRTNLLKIRFPFLVNYQEKLALKNRIDFWGINYYYRLHTHFSSDINRPMLLNFIDREGLGMSDLGWEIYPAGLWEAIQWVRRTGKPFYITENGIADAGDRLRQDFIQRHLKIAEQAVEAGYPLHGYFHWSLLDNYEWLEGNSARFGLYAVGHDQQRTLRPGGKLYRDYLKRQLEKKTSPGNPE